MIPGLAPNEHVWLLPRAVLTIRRKGAPINGFKSLSDARIALCAVATGAHRDRVSSANCHAHWGCGFPLRRSRPLPLWPDRLLTACANVKHDLAAARWATRTCSKIEGSVSDWDNHTPRDTARSTGFLRSHAGWPPFRLRAACSAATGSARRRCWRGSSRCRCAPDRSAYPDCPGPSR